SSVTGVQTCALPISGASGGSCHLLHRLSVPAVGPQEADSGRQDHVDSLCPARSAAATSWTTCSPIELSPNGIRANKSHTRRFAGPRLLDGRSDSSWCLIYSVF